MLASEGSGDDFIYATALHGLSNGQPCILTEKWNGTTAQATNRGVFRRRDRFAVGDRCKHGASGEDRYFLERLDLSKGCSAKNIDGLVVYAVAPYIASFSKLEQGVCVYFEVVGTTIQARYQADSDGIHGMTFGCLTLLATVCSARLQRQLRCPLRSGCQSWARRIPRRSTLVL